MLSWLLFTLLVSTTLGAQITDEEFNAYVKRNNLTAVINPCKELVASHQIPCELHQITTADGFKLLTIHLPNHWKAKSVIFMHGLMGTSNAWLIGDNSALAFALRAWTAGFDIWIPNSRGNEYSLEKEGTPISDPAFWASIDWDFMAQYDVPAYLDYVQAAKPNNKIAYVGHSQGTVQMFAALIENHGRVQDRVGLYVALAPVGRVRAQSNPALLAMAHLQFDSLFALFGATAFPPFDTSAVEVLTKLKVKCNTNEKRLCDNIVYDLEGATPAFLSQLAESLVGFAASTTSIRNIGHWLQQIRSGKFQKYDYGLLGNLFFYHSPTPPEYDPTTIKKVPMVLYSGGLDNLADPSDVAWLTGELQETGLIKRAKIIEQYQHNDFLWADNSPDSALKLVWEDVLSDIEAF